MSEELDLDLEEIELVDEEGNVVKCVVLARLELEGRQYAIVLDDESEDEAGILRIDVNEQGNEKWVVVHDDEEWDRVAEAWELFAEEDDDGEECALFDLDDEADEDSEDDEDGQDKD